MMQLQILLGVIAIVIPLIANSQSVPSPRWGHTLVYDPNNKQLVLFGGRSEAGQAFFDDTWIWDGKRWNKINVDGPPARGFCASAYHEKRKTVVIHGGRASNGSTLSDMWEWDGKTWKQLEAGSSYKADHHQMVYIPEEESLLAFGGWDGEQVTGSTWLWSNAWKKSQSASPPPRAAFGMAYDKKIHKILLFGGLWVDGQYADLWEYSKDAWRALSEPYENSSLDHHQMIFDESLQSVIGFGGKNYRYVAQGSTFRFEKSKLIILSKEGPSQRHSFGLARGHSTTYLFGGKEFKNEKQVALGDFWKWDGTKWQRID